MITGNRWSQSVNLMNWLLSSCKTQSHFVSLFGKAWKSTTDLSDVPTAVLLDFAEIQDMHDCLVPAVSERRLFWELQTKCVFLASFITQSQVDTGIWRGGVHNSQSEIIITTGELSIYELFNKTQIPVLRTKPQIRISLTLRQDKMIERFDSQKLTLIVESLVYEKIQISYSLFMHFE